MKNRSLLIEFFTKRFKTIKSFFKKWFTFFWIKHFELSFNICGYFDNRPRIIIAPGFFHFSIILPFRNNWTDECDPPKWGIAIHNNTFWIYLGGKGNFNGGTKWITWDIPFFTKEWVRTSILLKDDTWAHSTKKDKKSFFKEEWASKKKTWHYDFTDKFDGEIIPTTITVSESEWRPKWLGWTSLFAKVNQYIDVEFSKECGSRKGSWKGGVLGCSSFLNKDENVFLAIKRLEEKGV